jgi:hypothetical protein
MDHPAQPKDTLPARLPIRPPTRPLVLRARKLRSANARLLDFRMLVRYLNRNSIRFIPAVKRRLRMRLLAIRLREQSPPCRRQEGMFALLWRREAILHIGSHATIMSCGSQTN